LQVSCRHSQDVAEKDMGEIDAITLHGGKQGHTQGETGREDDPDGGILPYLPAPADEPNPDGGNDCHGQRPPKERLTQKIRNRYAGQNRMRQGIP